MAESPDFYQAAGHSVHAASTLPTGVICHNLKNNCDERGVFTEFYRESWGGGPRPLQWNMVRSEANVMRGFHVHTKHVDYLTVVSGELLLGLYDFRAGSPTLGQSFMFTINDRDPVLVEIPVGVGHGFYFSEPSIHVYGVSQYFRPEDELGCRWDAEELGLTWPCDRPLLSEKDRKAMSFTDLVQALGPTE